jgi:hypothetical protein
VCTVWPSIDLGVPCFSRAVSMCVMFCLELKCFGFKCIDQIWLFLVIRFSIWPNYFS